MAKLNKIFKEFSFWGQQLYKKELVAAASGNLSFKDGRYIFITRAGSLLGFLKPADIIKVTLNSACPADKNASSELPAHRAILRQLPHNVAIHAHPPYTIAASLKFGKIALVDLEGQYYFPELSIVETELKPGAAELPQKLPAILSESKLAVVSGHGVFAAGDNFREVFTLISSLEASARILLLAK
jgi:L-fuculose-phosphate aldolase